MEKRPPRQNDGGRGGYDSGRGGGYSGGQRRSGGDDLNFKLRQLRKKFK